MNRNELDEAVMAKLRHVAAAPTSGAVEPNSRMLAAISKTFAHECVDAVLGAIAEAVGQDAEVRIVGFGIFESATRGPRTGRNPRTGEPVEIGERRSVRFRAARRLKAAVQNSAEQGDQAA